MTGCGSTTEPITLAAAAALMLPPLAFAQPLVTDPQLIAVARQSLLMQQQTLAALNKIDIIQQSQTGKLTRYSPARRG